LALNTELNRKSMRELRCTNLNQRMYFVHDRQSAGIHRLLPGIDRPTGRQRLRARRPAPGRCRPPSRRSLRRSRAAADIPICLSSLPPLPNARKRRAVLLIARLDRLARNVAFISALMENGTDFIACDMPTANRLTIHILAAVAKHEREMISKRTKAALAEAKRRGKMLGNPRIEDARVKATAHHHAHRPAPEVSNLIAAWRRQAWTLRRIADELNRLGIRPPRGRAWYASSVRNQLVLSLDFRTSP